ncbi:MarR family winged helix-turn-helix transcriptional regulator [Bordetella sp. 15P40C-2]|uniref:MarR family winged helix-turn-helix transcriptional regulator n=1 Tax=Bordetella sp. 15P40C-2 TaxID=2572246 RepID=UPI001327E48B|nr:MarR family transcriptional regulator [Bordetella sp. 15P40C-2]MVW73582.1 MarR family transcriptional regulator [Bordetella sp. 15P40C-2]
MDTPATRLNEKGATLAPSDFAVLADFRYQLRRFALNSETEAQAHGLAPQQHQALVVIKAQPTAPTVTELSERLCIKSHSAAELVNRLVQMGMLERRADPNDGRRALLYLTPNAERTLEALSAAHLSQLQNIRPLLMGMLEKFDR